MRRYILATALILASVFPAQAVQPDEVLKDAKLEQRARDLSRELRCMVCQNQSIDDSDAPLARDLRVLVRERLTAGDSDSQVIDYLVARYGQFVLLRPRFEWQTALLWLTPGVVLIAGAIGAIAFVRRRNAGLARDEVFSAPAKLSPEEEARLAKLSSVPTDRS
ncbi:MAG TPA: cytochrome c-type biogenesis protein [Xanthobacteraceae bacterium]|nr:cytochrome c-type biogenesis protein [Xanthobacteraceae bacterium]